MQGTLKKKKKKLKRTAFIFAAGEVDSQSSEREERQREGQTPALRCRRLVRKCRSSSLPAGEVKSNEISGEKNTSSCISFSSWWWVAAGRGCRSLFGFHLPPPPPLPARIWVHRCLYLGRPEVVPSCVGANGGGNAV